MKLVVKKTDTYVTSDGKTFYEKEPAQRHEWLVINAAAMETLLKESAKEFKLESEADSSYYYVPFENLPELLYRLREPINAMLMKHIKEED